MAPWNWMTPRQIFAVRDPISGERSWIQVLAGQNPSACAFLGDRSYELLKKREAGQILHEDELHDTDQLILQFQPDPSLPMPGRVRPRGPGTRSANASLYPILARKRPGCLPGMPEPEDWDRMSTVAEQLMALAPRLLVTPGLIDAEHPGGLLVRELVEMDGKTEWTDTRISSLPPSGALIPDPEANLDAKHLEYLRKHCMSFEATLDCDLFFLPTTVRERGALHETFVAMFVLVDPESGMMLWGEPLPCSRRWSAAQAALLEWIEYLQRYPERIRVRRPELQAQLEPLARAFGFQLTLERELPQCESLQNDVTLHFQTLGPRHPLVTGRGRKRTRPSEIKTS